MSQVRLDMLISKALNVSRKDAKGLIAKGRIAIDKEIIKRPDAKVDDGCEISFDSKSFFYQKFLYILQNKPLGIISSTDGYDGKTVLDILPEQLKRNGLFPAGRLDKYSCGMMIITDDGKFAHSMLSPSCHVEKEYYVKTAEDVISEKMAEEFSKGVYLGEGQYSSPAQMRIIDSRCAYITIHEGIYHQVRRMIKAMGGTVIALKRVRIGDLALDENLKEGESRLLTENEKEALLKRKI